MKHKVVPVVAKCESSGVLKPTLTLKSFSRTNFHAVMKKKKIKNQCKISEVEQMEQFGDSNAFI